MQLDHYAVVGNPVEYSLSPVIHAEFAKQTHQSMDYTKKCLPLDGFNAGIDHLIKDGFRGVNIRMPFKLEAFDYANKLTPRAELAKSVNTLCFNGNTILGDNTDGIGLMKDIKQRLQWPLRNKQVILLGAGGAARGLVPALLAERLSCLTILNRHGEKAVNLAKDYQHLGVVQGADFSTETIDADVLINTVPWTKETLEKQVLFSLKSHLYCYDICYAKTPTAFLNWGVSQGIQHISDGLGMLVEQAAESFELWRGVSVDSTPVFELLTIPE